MKSINISSGNLPESVDCPRSKSHSNRALALAALDLRAVEIRYVADCEDTRYMLHGLKALGLKIEERADSVVVHGSLSRVSEAPKDPIYLGEGGTTIRFFMALVATLPFEFALRVHSDFLKRPIDEYLDLFHALGAKASVKQDIIRIQGPLRAGQTIEVDCSKTTQFASALELVSDTADLKVIPKNIKASAKYLEMTGEVKREIKEEALYTVPADFSSLGYFAAYACLSHKLVVKGIETIDRGQADSQILDIIKALGAKWEFVPEGLAIGPATSFTTMDVDGSTCIDLVPTLAFLFAYSGSEHSIRNIQNLRFKESDRLAQTLRLLEVFEVEHTYDDSEDVLWIKGKAPDKKVRTLEVARDHRMVMAAAMFIKLNGGGSIAPAQAVAKSFPRFFEYFS